MLVIVAGLALAAAPAAADVVNEINAIGLIDYTHPPKFKVGDYAKYHMTGSSTSGLRDEYTLTVLIAGEEEFWGEKGFWVETWTDFVDRAPQAFASLMSYSVFQDSLPEDRMEYYMRKTVNTLRENGTPEQLVMMIPTEALTSRVLGANPKKVTRDTIGADTVTTPAGHFNALHVKFRFGKGITESHGDSTFYQELRENRDVYYSDDVPVTRLVRESIETSQEKRSWMIGRSQEGSPLRLVERGAGTARLIEYGSGLKPRLLPMSMYKSFADRVAPATAKKSAATAPPKR
jgi:hypothetical protein